MICLVTGIFILTFSGGEPIDPRLVGILPAQDLINICRIASDLGISGDSCFLPPRLTGETRVMLFNPVSIYQEARSSPEILFPFQDRQVWSPFLPAIR